MMDMFMDKLAQKLNAQEIIRANTTAETEELNKLRSRVAEYNECLDKLAALVENSRAKLENAQVDSAELKADTEELRKAIATLQSLAEANTGDIKAITEKVETIVASSGENVHKECVKVYRNVQAVVVEEGAKQAEGLEVVTAKVNAVKGKASAAFGMSIVTFILVLCSVIMQVLDFLNISLF